VSSPVSGPAKPSSPPAEVAAIRPETGEPARHPLSGRWAGRGVALQIAGTDKAPSGSLAADASAVAGGISDNQAQMVALREIGHRDIENVTFRGHRLNFTTKGSTSTLHVELDVAADGRSMSGWAQYGSVSWRPSLTRQ
jgi:hypothetical protein